MNSVYLGLGSNLGDREQAIQQALFEIDQLDGTQVIRVSSLYDTDPVGVDDQPAFLNAVVHVETSQPPEQLRLALPAHCLDCDAGAFQWDVGVGR